MREGRGVRWGELQNACAVGRGEERRLEGGGRKMCSHPPASSTAVCMPVRRHTPASSAGPTPSLGSRVPLP
eukprot:5211399-Prymnesium_polylepis.1